MKILILTDSYPPEIRSAAELMKDLAEGLAIRGEDVSVITSRPFHNVAGAGKEIAFVSEENGVRVIRPKVFPHHGVPFFVRGLAQLALPFIFYRAARRYVPEADVVIVHSPPLPLGISAACIKRKYGARFILNLHDIFPQNGVDLGILKPGPALRFFERMEKYVYRKADLIVVPSGEHAEYIIKNRNIPEEKTRVIPHWLKMEPFERAVKSGRFRREFGLEDKFVFMFAGVLGPSQGLDMILEIAGKMSGKDDVRFLFVGEGAKKQSLMESAAKRGLSNVLFKPLVPAADYPELVKDMDVGLVTLTAKNTTPAVPAKLMGYMAGSLPVLALLHARSEALKIVADSGCGYGTVSDDAEKALHLAERMYEERANLPEMGRRGYEYAKRHFAREVCVDAWEKALADQVFRQERKRDTISP